jgi:Ca-activated chloride channel family protein
VPPTPAALRQVAAATGGKFFTAASADELEVVYAELKSRLGKKKEEREIADAFAAGAVLLLLGGGALSTVWFRRLP